MALKYIEQLSDLFLKIFPQKTRGIKLEVKHFFSGAALYVNGKIFATLTPKGFAIKLPADIIKGLLEEKKAKPLCYFPKAPVKKGYALLSKEVIKNTKLVKKLAILSMKYVIHLR